MHEDKRHIYEDGDCVTFREIEGMDELNGHEPIPIEVIDGFSFKLAIDTTKFKEYKREGLVENVKVAKKI